MDQENKSISNKDFLDLIKKNLEEIEMSKNYDAALDQIIKILKIALPEFLSKYAGHDSDLINKLFHSKYGDSIIIMTLYTILSDSANSDPRLSALRTRLLLRMSNDVATDSLQTVYQTLQGQAVLTTTETPQSRVRRVAKKKNSK